MFGGGEAGALDFAEFYFAADVDGVEGANGGVGWERTQLAVHAAESSRYQQLLAERSPYVIEVPRDDDRGVVVESGEWMAV